MRYSLRSLLILAALVPPVLAGALFLAARLAYYLLRTATPQGIKGITD